MRDRKNGKRLWALPLSRWGMYIKLASRGGPSVHGQPRQPPAVTPRSIEPGSIQIHQVVEPASAQRKILPRFDATGKSKSIFCPIHHLTASCSVIPVTPPGTGTQRESLLGRLGRASLAAPSRTAWWRRRNGHPLVRFAMYSSIR